MFRIGTLTLRSRVFQSPMADCTDLAFRLVSREYGMEMAYPEMISAEALIRRTPQTLNMMKTTLGDRPLGLQLVGSDPDHMAEAAQIVEEMGFDLVDVNIGCPVKKVTSKCAGSALLREPDLADQIFRKMAKAVKRIPLTVKLRLGYADPSGKEAIRLAKSAEEEGFSAVAVHGRTRVQAYSGKADYAAIGRIKAALSIPVIGNGDVIDAESAKRLMDESGCDGVMIGRGALGNPWIYCQVNAMLCRQRVPASPTVEERRAALLKHFGYLVQYEGEHALLKMRRVAVWYFKGEPGVVHFREEIQRLESLTKVENLIRSFQPAHPTSSVEAVGEGKVVKHATAA